MVDRTYWRLTDMRDSIREINHLLDGKSIEVLHTNVATRAAFERFLEIVSEASRHVPEEWQKEFGHIPWRQVADLGNFLRRVYHKTDVEILWSIYKDDLTELKAVVDNMIGRMEPPK